jgi:hypothetical protein
MQKNLSLLFLVLLLAGSAFGKGKLEGVWQTMEVKTIGGSNSGTFSKEPGILIFTGKHYSMMLPISDTRTQVDPSKATADQLRDLYGPFIANAGTCEVSGDALTLRPIVAKNPRVLKVPPTKYSFHVDGDTLTITSPDLNITLKRLE